MSEYRREQAWKAGYNAGLAGKPRASCKREQGTIFFDDWHDGFNDAERAIERFNATLPEPAHQQGEG